MNGDSYHHTQKGPWGLMCSAFAAGFLVVSVSLPILASQITFMVTGFFMLLLGASNGHLAVEDEGDRLVVRFGPFPLFRRSIPHDDILEVEQSRTTFLDGWVIHWSPWAVGSGTSGDTIALSFDGRGDVHTLHGLLMDLSVHDLNVIHYMSKNVGWPG
jgi:hypothetical protein